MDGAYVEEQLLDPVVPIYINGKTQVAKEINIETTVPVSDSNVLLLFLTSACVYMCQTKWNLEDLSFSTTMLFQIITFLWCVLLYQIVLQKLRIYCDPQQSERETACEIYSVVRLVFWFVVGHHHGPSILYYF